ncbi:MAG: nuclear transport factor 2 family protein [Alphaproteobacteria bacterium]
MSDLEAEVRALREEVEQLKSREEIRQQITRYGRGQEWLDGSLMDEVFWPDAHVDFGFFKGVWKDYKPVLMEIEADGETTFHLCAAPQIELNGDTAYVEVYGIAGGRNNGKTNVFGGRYIDRWDRRDGVWKIGSRQYVLDWHIDQVVEGPVGGPHPELEYVNPRSPEHRLFRRMGMDVTG